MFTVHHNKSLMKSGALLTIPTPPWAQRHSGCYLCPSSTHSLLPCGPSLHVLPQGYLSQLRGRGKKQLSPLMVWTCIQRQDQTLYLEFNKNKSRRKRQNVKTQVQQSSSLSDNYTPPNLSMKNMKPSWVLQFKCHSSGKVDGGMDGWMDGCVLCFCVAHCTQLT